MGRPVYETAHDRARETGVSEALALAWRCEVHKLPRLYACDFAVMRDNVVQAWLEIKVRNASYSTYLLSLHKWIKGVELSEATGKPFLLVVSWPVDGERVICYRPLVREPVHVVLGGRKDRGDPNDVEPMVEIPMSGFRTIRPVQEKVEA